MGNLSRQYRPQLFTDITGQMQVVETLRREIEQDKLGHAYLFSGPRGVGKTTVARIFAKAVNCLESKKGEPCLKCEACKRVDEQQAIDIIEMDAASHTGVANVREAIVEHVRFVPAHLKYKVYIIDEAHMLSDSSWNALLKTIEEPPSYAIFIFATTERHKVPATIVSRCQRFSFTRIASDEMVKRLKEIAKKEDVSVDDNVLRTIASRSEGCLRDAENLLGQLFSLGEQAITDEIASIIIPASQQPLAAEMLTLAFQRDLGAVLARIEAFEQQGIAFLPLFDDCIAALRQLLLATHLTTHQKQLAAGDDGEQQLAKLVGSVAADELVRASLILMERRREAKQGLDARFAFELGFSAIALNMTSGGPPLNSGQSGSPKTPPPPPVAAPNQPTVKSEPSPPPPAPVMESVVSESPAPSSEKISEPDPSLPKSAKTLDDVLAIWPKFLQAFESNKSLLFILKPSRPQSFDGLILSVEFQYQYHLKTIQQPKHHERISEALCRLLDCPTIEIQGVVASDMAADEPKKDHSVVHNLLDAFGGQVVS